jgi:hypothetical protein
VVLELPGNGMVPPTRMSPARGADVFVIHDNEHIDELSGGLC